jgi:protein O-GlcNAc transferase
MNGVAATVSDRQATQATQWVAAPEIAQATTATLEKALALHQTGQLDEAEAIYSEVLQQQPGNASVLHDLGVVHAQRGNFARAAELVRKAVEIAPGKAAYHSTLGNILVDLGLHDDAVVSHERALAIAPDSAEVLVNLGAALFRGGQHDAALASFGRALAIRPEHVDAHCYYGEVLAHQKRYSEALDIYDRAIIIDPECARAFADRGFVLGELRRDVEALSSYDRALIIQPDYLDVLNNRAVLFMVMHSYERAAQDFARLVELAPAFSHALDNKLRANMLACNWKSYVADRELLCTQVRAGKRAVQPFAFLHLSNNGEDILTCARTFVAHAYPPADKALWAGERYQHDRIRIAYLSADLREHAVSYLIADLIALHDKTRFEVSAWSFGPDVEDRMRARLRKSFEHFHDVERMTDIEIATRLRAQEIDIVVDLMGFTQGCRTPILAHRAVPIQVNYIGYVGTMGAGYMDYIIGDADVIPVECESFYAEKVARLPDVYQVNDSKRVISPNTPSRAEMGLPETGFVFCCFNSNYKITPEVFDVWMRLLKRVEGSVLWLIEGSVTVSRNLRSEAEARGVRADRLVFAKHASPPDYLARYRLADLFLDTLPYNAGATASDALWVGLPVLTCKGNAFQGRMASSLLRAVGLPELITGHYADYESMAFKLATTPNLLNALKARLAQNKNTCALFDVPRFTRHIESAYVTMYERFQRGELPQSFSVAGIP